LKVVDQRVVADGRLFIASYPQLRSARRGADIAAKESSPPLGGCARRSFRTSCGAVDGKLALCVDAWSWRSSASDATLAKRANVMQVEATATTMRKGVERFMSMSFRGLRGDTSARNVQRALIGGDE
jgi:hypothetical protein